MAAVSRVLSGRPFRLMFAAYGVSMLGSAIAPVALAFGVLAEPGGTATTLGLVLFARSAAQVCFLLFGGVLADRIPRNRLMIVANVLAGCAQLAIATMFIRHVTPLAALMALTAVNGAAGALFLPASKGLVPQIVESGDLQQANGLLRLTRNTSMIGGAALAGILVTTAGSGVALIVDAATFFAAAGLLLGVPPRSAATDTEDERYGLLGELGEGWSEFRSRRWVWVSVAQFAVVNLCFGPSINVLGPVVARQHFSGAGGWSVILAAEAIGLAVGSLVALRLKPRFALRTGTLCTFGFLPPFLLLAVAAPLPLVALSLLVNGLCVDVYEVMWDTSLQTHLPAAALSRVSSYDLLGSFVLGPIGLALAGPIAHTVGVSTTLLGAGGLVLAATVLANINPAVRHLPNRPIEAT